MKRTNKNVAAVTMAAAMACGALARGGTVGGDWSNQTNDGWFDWTASNGGTYPTNNPGADPTDNWPSAYYNYSNTTGVTLGNYSLKMKAQSGYSQNMSLKTEYETDSEGNSEMADFFNNTELTIQVAYNANEWSPNAGAEVGMALNAQTYGFQNWPTSYPYNSIGGPNYDTGNPSNPGNWDAADYASPGTGGITTRTMTWSYANLLPGGSASTTIPANAGWVEFIMATICYDNSETLVPGNFYFGDARFTNTPVTTEWQAGQHPQGSPYNWGTIDNFTQFNESTGLGGMPCNPGDTVTFGNSSIPSGITETIDLNANQDFQISVGTMIFNNPTSSYVIAQGTGGSFSTLTLNGNVYNPSGTTTAGTAKIADESGNHTISAPVALATNTTIAVGNSANSFTISGNISGTGGLALAAVTQALMVGTVVLSGSNTYSGGTTVTSGTLLINPTSTPATTSALAAGSVSVTGGLLQLAAGVSGGSGPAVTSSVNLTSLSITGNGVLDVNNNHVIITYGSSDPFSTIAGYIKSGYNGGGWNGPGIISTAALTKTNGLSYGVGYADGVDGKVSGLVSGQIEVAYTLLGDANLDGLVNAADFTILAANFNQPVTGWDQGDFNYDGLVNAADFTDLAANFNQSVSGAASAGDVAALDAFAAANGISLANVPEPASMGLLAMGAVGVLARRRRGA
ncbi:MAG: PEP-CTERM sorting domain-containing protein [Tepidisphaeraceae bacterium]|jgi:autotransporter-associated beta strand protein